MKWQRFIVKCPPAAVEAVVGIMLDVVGSGPSVEDAGDLKVVSVYTPASPEAEGRYMDLRATLMRIPGYLAGPEPLRVDQEVVQDQDWEHAWKEFYHPFRVGRRLVIKPSWETWPPADDPEAAQPDDIVIELDPEMAFGTGIHPTTQLCLCALEDLVQPGMPVLDVGCGSGILSLAAVMLGASEAIAIDVDPIAVSTAQSNAARNEASESIDVRRGDIAGVDEDQFHIVVANINAPVVRELAASATARLVPGGYYIVSGLIEDSVEEVRADLLEAGLGVVDVRRHEGWACLVGRKPN